MLPSEGSFGVDGKIVATRSFNVQVNGRKLICHYELKLSEA